MSNDQLEIIVDGHVARSLLHDFVENQEQFDEDIVEKIWEHLDVCEDCMEDYDRIQSGDVSGTRDFREHHRKEPAEPSASSTAPERFSFDADDLTTPTLGDSPPPKEESEPADEPVEATEHLETEAPESAKAEETAGEETVLEMEIDLEDDVFAPGPADPTAEAAPDTPADTPPRAVPETPKPAPKPKRRTRPAPPATPRPKPQVSRPTHPIARVLKAIPVPPQALLAAAVLVAVVGIAFAVYTQRRSTSGPVEGWAPLDVVDTRVPLQELLIRRVHRGRIARAHGTDVTLDFRGIGELVVAIDLDFLKYNPADRYELVMRDSSGNAVFQKEIPQLYLDDGRVFVRLVPRLFTTGEIYGLDLLAYTGEDVRVIAKSAFDVAK